MRIYLKLSKNKELIPFNNQHLLTAALHRWLGADNELHDKQSLYCFSWLQNVIINSKGVNLTNESYFFISAYDQGVIKKVISGIMKDAYAFCGSFVVDIQIKEVPDFGNTERFMLSSPVLVKQKIEGQRKFKYLTYDEDDFEIALTDNLKNKMVLAGVQSEGVQVIVDRTFEKLHTKLIDYKGVLNKVNMCPVIISGTSEQVAFAWSCGLGFSTGIGFGSLK
ncbi:CRISPR-associated endoribonuclease Cas6 [Myroides odoratimimus]|uniref:CRISPR-associated endoribonuclease Cas6 n=1 Tax=Myroides odoratimimus TaxID=76832 RepID=UPI000469B873|nr:CRISPR-associated endoribonuclease Cas6 [Myroides odoratimimus]